MKFAILILILSLTVQQPTIGQKQLTETEILDSWTSQLRSTTSKDFRNVSVDEKCNERINSILDSLHENNIDSILIYTIAYPGYITSDRCFFGSYPIYSYIIWYLGNQLFIRSFKGGCETTSSNFDSIGLIDFYRRHYDSVFKETFMPVIFGATQTNEGKISYSMKFLDHEPKYSIHIKSGNNFKILSFAENDIRNEQSLFHRYNQRLNSYLLWELIKREVSNYR